MIKIEEMSHAEGWTPYRNKFGDWVWQMPDDYSPHDMEWPGIKAPSFDCVPVWQGDGWYWSQPTPRALDGAEVAPEGGVFHIEWLDADTIRLTPRR